MQNLMDRDKLEKGMVSAGMGSSFHGFDFWGITNVTQTLMYIIGNANV